MELLDCFVAGLLAMTRNEAAGGLHHGDKRNGTLYTGVTSDLVQRAWQHREGLGDGFTKRYRCKLLVWFELPDTMDAAIAREKQIKGGSRAKKLALIEALNPDWRDLFDDIAAP